MLSRSTATSELLAAGWLAAIVESSDDAIVSKNLDGTADKPGPTAGACSAFFEKMGEGR